MNDFDSAILNLKKNLSQKVPEKVYKFNSHCEATQHLQKIIQERLSIGYDLVETEKENTMPIFKEIVESDRRRKFEIEKNVLTDATQNSKQKTASESQNRKVGNLTEVSVNQIENLRKRPPASISQLLDISNVSVSNASFSAVPLSSTKTNSIKSSLKENDDLPAESSDIITVVFNSKSKSRTNEIEQTEEKLKSAESKFGSHLEDTPSDNYYITCDSKFDSNHKSAIREEVKAAEEEPQVEYEFSPLDDLDQEDINEIYDKHSHSNVLFDGLSVPDEENDAAPTVPNYQIDLEKRLAIIDSHASVHRKMNSQKYS